MWMFSSAFIVHLKQENLLEHLNALCSSSLYRLIASRLLWQFNEWICLCNSWQCWYISSFCCSVFLFIYTNISSSVCFYFGWTAVLLLGCSMVSSLVYKLSDSRFLGHVFWCYLYPFSLISCLKCISDLKDLHIFGKCEMTRNYEDAFLVKGSFFNASLVLPSVQKRYSLAIILHWNAWETMECDLHTEKYIWAFNAL